MERKPPPYQGMNRSPMLDYEGTHRSQERGFNYSYYSRRLIGRNSLGGHINAHRENEYEAIRVRRALPTVSMVPIAVMNSSSPSYTSMLMGNSTPITPEVTNLTYYAQGHQFGWIENDRSTMRLASPGRMILPQQLAIMSRTPEVIYMGDGSENGDRGVKRKRDFDLNVEPCEESYRVGFDFATVIRVLPVLVLL